MATPVFTGIGCFAVVLGTTAGSGKATIVDSEVPEPPFDPPTGSNDHVLVVHGCVGKSSESEQSLLEVRG